MIDLRRTVDLVVDVGTWFTGSQEPLQLNGHDMSLNLPVHGFRPNCCAIAEAATSVASLRRDGSRVSISPRSGPLWQYAIAGMRGETARLRVERRDHLGVRVKPPSCKITAR